MSLQHWQLWQENSSKLWDDYLQKRREELGQEPISGSQKVLELNRNERITAWLLYIGIWKYKSKLVIRNMLIQCICCSMLFDVVLILWKDLFLSDYKVVGSELLRRDFWCGALMLAGLPQRSAQALVLIEMRKHQVQRTNHTWVERGCRFIDWKSLKHIEMVFRWCFSRKFARRC